MEQRYDKYLLGATVLLTIIGTVMIYSASAFRYNDSMYFLKRHLFNLCIGGILFYLGWKIEHHFWQRYAMVGIIFACLLTLLPIIQVKYLGGEAIKNVNRFVSLGGFSFQPSEIARFLVVVFLAEELSRRRPVIQSFRYGLLPVIVPVAIVIFIIVKQHSYGMALGFSLVTMTMFIFSNVRWKHLLILALTIFVLIGISIRKTPYAFARVKSFFLESDPQESGYQTYQAFIALGRGGIIGVGLGNGLQKLFYVPEVQTDFIFAIIGEELGIWGTTMIVALFAIIAWRGIKIALRAPDTFGGNVAIGITSMIFIFALINLAVVTRSIPTTGIPLPFVSYGGTQLITNLFMIGVLLNISESIKFPHNEKLQFLTG